MSRFSIPFLFACVIFVIACSKDSNEPIDYTSQVTGKYHSDADSTLLTVNVTAFNQLEFIFERTDSNGLQTWDFDQVVLRSDLIFQQPEHDYGLIWTNFTGEVFPFRSTCNGIFKDNRVHFQSQWIYFDGRK
jgi:hypothetical protein